MGTRCVAICDDFDRLRYHAPAQRITVPGDKFCSWMAVGQLGPLPLCSRHVKMAREGLLHSSGRVAPRVDINNVRKYPAKFPHGLYDWARNASYEPLDEAAK